MTEICDVSPLSPVRAWASSRSFISGHLVADDRADSILRNQRGDHGDHLLGLLPRAATAGGTIGVECLHLVADADRLRQGFRAAYDSNADLGQVGIPDHAALVNGVYPNHFEAYLACANAG